MSRTMLLAAFVAAGTGVAAAQVATIPSPSNPTPDYPVATDGSPLPRAVNRAYVATPFANEFKAFYVGERPAAATRAR